MRQNDIKENKNCYQKRGFDLYDEFNIFVPRKSLHDRGNCFSLFFIYGFYTLFMQDLSTVIKSILEEEILDDDLFLIELRIQQEGKAHVIVSIDGDHGVTIDQCAIVSRDLGNLIEERELIDVPYVLQVSSAGVGQPLRIKRQYRNNIHRFLEIQLKNATKMITGQLIGVTEDEIQVLEEVKKTTKNKSKKNHLATEATRVRFEEIQSAVVKIIF